MPNALGIISYEDASVHVEGLDDYRPIPSLSFLGRYRLIDFILSNFTNSGIKNIQVYVKDKPRSVIEHLGSGRQYNINSKHGKLQILTGEGKVHSEAYNHDVTAYLQNMQFIEDSPYPYVIIAPSHFVYTVDFRRVLASHIESKADVTVLYNTVDNANTHYIGADSLSLDDKKQVLEIKKNRGKYKNRHISLGAYVMSKDAFIAMVHLADNLSSLYTLREVLQEQVSELVMIGYPVKGYVACVNSLEEYHRINLDLLNPEHAHQLFNPDWPIHTRTSDSCPTQFTSDARVSDATLANGCYIEGTIRHSVIGRGVVVKPGAVIENSVILSNSIIGENVHLKNVVVDKMAHIRKVKELVAEDGQVLYVKRNDKV